MSEQMKQPYTVRLTYQCGDSTVCSTRAVSNTANDEHSGCSLKGGCNEVGVGLHGINGYKVEPEGGLYQVEWLEACIYVRSGCKQSHTCSM
jgi:hypothetical protein